jgi:hypothetical protein
MVRSVKVCVTVDLNQLALGSFINEHCEKLCKLYEDMSVVLACSLEQQRTHWIHGHAAGMRTAVQMQFLSVDCFEVWSIPFTTDDLVHVKAGSRVFYLTCGRPLH